MVPFSSAASTMALAIRSLTEAEGLKLSNLAISSAPQPNCPGNRFNRTNGVPPINDEISEAIGIKKESEAEHRLNQTTEDAQAAVPTVILVPIKIGGVMAQRP